MRPTKKFVRGVGLKAVFAFCMILFASCKYELVKEPTFNYNEKKNAADYSDFILPPAKVNASQGLSRTVLLEWEAVPNAVQYYIYSAVTPYDNFTKISETKSNETQISIDEESGITKYYCVSAVNYYGTVSSKSVVASGSTLAVPIITQITPTEEGTEVLLNWWMDNCNENTYEKFVEYNIFVYANASSNIVLKTLSATGDKRSALIEGLVSKTEYYFTIEITNKKSGAKEISSRTSAQTAHRVIPDPPADFEVTKGISEDQIILSWTLPEKAWYRENAGSSGFVPHPLYFKIFKKDKNSSNDEYEELEIQKVTGEYTLGELKSYIDTNVERGKQYEYYIQSFTDGVPEGKEITADSSKSALESGWLICFPRVYIESDYNQQTENNVNSFTKITFNPHLDFESFGVSYKYILERKKTQLNSTDFEANPLVTEFETIDALEKYKEDFDNPADSDQAGYYYYKLYICPPDADAQDYTTANYIVTAASGKYIVTHDASKVPVIEDFEVDDGYSNKFVLSWKYNPEYTYIIHYTDGQSQENELELDSAEECFDGKNKDDIITYNHEAPAGIQRIYSLEASTGLSKTVKPFNSTEDIAYKTLGVPDPKITVYDFDKITVEWNAVQMAAEDYTVTAHYADEADELASGGVLTSTDIDKYSFVISEPDGYDDAQKSGKTIKLKVTATSSRHGDNTNSKEIDVCTLGPALTDTKVAQLVQHKVIDVQWNAVTGAAGYIIKRVCYKKGNTAVEPTSADKDVYYYDGKKLYVNNEPADPNCASIKLSGNVFTLTDTAREPQDITKSYEINQGRIKWGVPYEYFVIPVKQTGKEPSFTYTNIPVKRGATYGYGLNVKAEKADNSKKQIIEWTAPFVTEDNTANIFYRDAGNTSNKWTKIVNLTRLSDTKVSFDPESKTGAYEYVVVYKTDDSILSESVSTSFINDTDVGLSVPESSYNRYDYTGVPMEKASKGYLLAVNMNPQKGDDAPADYSEAISWDPWNYEYRSIGPVSAELFIKNYNVSNEWIKMADLDNRLYISSTQTLNNTTVSKDGNVKIILKPTNMMDGTINNPVTAGPLMVLRDIKHYYELKLIKNDREEYIGDDNQVYGYRTINDYEFAKVVMAIFSNAMVNIDILDFENKSDGNASFVHDSVLQLGYNYDFRFNNYTSLLLVPSGDYVNSLSITCTGRCSRNLLGSGGYPKNFSDPVTITMTNNDEEIPSCYKGNIKVTLSSNKKAKIEVGTNTILNVEDNETLRRIYIPFKMHKDETNYYNEYHSTYYGWWPQ